MTNLCLLSLLLTPYRLLLSKPAFVIPTVLEWQKTFEEKLSPLLSVRESLSEEEAQKMGRKDPEQEVEKFVTSNTQELGKDKWLCPLSGKKFKVTWGVKRMRWIGRWAWGSKTPKRLERLVPPGGVREVRDCSVLSSFPPLQPRVRSLCANTSSISTQRRLRR